MVENLTNTNQFKPGDVKWLKMRVDSSMPLSFGECKIIHLNQDFTYRVVTAEGELLNVNKNDLISKEELPEASALAIFTYKGDECPELKLFKGSLFYLTKETVFSPVLDVYFDVEFFETKLKYLFDVVPRTSVQAEAPRPRRRPLG